MQLEDATCYRALSARDKRFDGEFFVGVTTTGVYCRPVCPARTPRATRCRFFRCAAEAEKEGFRACFRCRPELAPGAAPIDARPRLLRAALSRIEEGALDGASVDDLASELGVTARHLRREMQRELGAGPNELAQQRRLARAKQLLADSAWPVSRVAFASGFSSLRRFNAAFRERFGAPPSEVRRGSFDEESCPVRLDARGPFAWDALLTFLRARATPGVEHIRGGRYRRTLSIGEHAGWIEARCEHERVHLDVAPTLLPVLAAVVARVRRLFDLDAAPARVHETLSPDRLLARRLERTPGLRVPGCIDAFEMVVRAILGQQISVAGATTLAGRIAAAHGEPIATPWPELSRLTPSATAIASASPLPGMPRARAATIQRVAEAFASGQRLGPGVDASWLSATKGIGPWTAQYVALRAGADPDAFPTTDLGLLKASGLSPAALAQRAEAWRPWRAYAAIALWMELDDDTSP
ncbi:MAG: AlkA N-terminal domain-containing protein [Sandaracinaceae bacterium]